MEKYYRVAAGSKVEKEYFEAQAIQKKISDYFFDEFAETVGITTDEFVPYTDRLVIIPNNADREKFRKSFMAGKDGFFKLSSATCKAWVNGCKERNLKFQRQPHLPFLFRPAFSCRWRMFDFDGTVYCMFGSDGDFDTPEGFIEIKASEYYKIIEDNDLA